MMGFMRDENLLFPPHIYSAQTPARLPQQLGLQTNSSLSAPPPIFHYVAHSIYPSTYLSLHLSDKSH
ncbi:hypothetical protein ACTXT7_011169 [Hymenolepis weldensis]